MIRRRVPRCNPCRHHPSGHSPPDESLPMDLHVSDRPTIPRLSPLVEDCGGRHEWTRVLHVGRVQRDEGQARPHRHQPCGLRDGPQGAESELLRRESGGGVPLLLLRTRLRALPAAARSTPLTPGLVRSPWDAKEFCGPNRSKSYGRSCTNRGSPPSTSSSSDGTSYPMIATSTAWPIGCAVPVRRCFRSRRASGDLELTVLDATPASASLGAIVVGAVLLAAVLHAAWNALAHAMDDQLVMFALMGACVTVAGGGQVMAPHRRRESVGRGLLGLPRYIRSTTCCWFAATDSATSGRYIHWQEARRSCW